MANAYSVSIGTNTVAMNGVLTFSILKNGVAVSGPTTWVLPTDTTQLRVRELLLAELKNSIATQEGTLSEVTESFSPPPLPSSGVPGGVMSGTAPAGQFVSGVNTSGQLLFSGIPFGSSAGTACSGNDPRLSDSRTPTSHGANSHDATVPQVIASGTATFSTSAIASLAQQTATISGTVTGLLSTDTVIWAYSGGLPASATDARLIVSVAVAAGALSISRSNPTAASITPTARIINWKVIR